MTDPIRIFVGCAANGEDIESQIVLEYTLHKHATMPLEITWMMQSHDISSPFYSNSIAGWQTQKWVTPFSGFRWVIPLICNFEGRAIYMDSDFIVLADIAELWNTPFEEGKAVIARGDGRFCCSLWDCAKVPQYKLSELMFDPNTHQRMNEYWKRHADKVQAFANGSWNYLDSDRPLALNNPYIKALHYTRIEQQLQLKHALPRLAAAGRRHWSSAGRYHANDWPGLQELFDSLLAEAIDNGYSVDRYTRPQFGPYRLKG